MRFKLLLFYAFWVCHSYASEIPKSFEDKINDLREDFLEIDRMVKQIAIDTGISTSHLNELEAKELQRSNMPEIVSPEYKEDFQNREVPSEVIKLSNKKKYYLGFNLGPAVFSDQDYLAGMGDIIIKGETGFLGKIFIERHLGDFIFDLGFSFSRKKHKSIEAYYLGAIHCNGQSETLSGFVGIGYQVSLTKNFSLIFSSSIGWLHSTVDVRSSDFGQLESSGYLINGALNTEVRYKFSDLLYGNLAYEFNVIGKDYPFSSYHTHSILSGVGMSF